ncbi:hypothetical protein KIW84_065507 [Lathyrus oleraceus]|uniref:Protein kinase domain-containing protein n=1 Tax=Pisum sativum TaxID=3888 RepID=A0A9D4WGY6_PEA|nr:hypothetical protein KIW84_065507 [Pisum sativum]
MAEVDDADEFCAKKANGGLLARRWLSTVVVSKGSDKALKTDGGSRSSIAVINHPQFPGFLSKKKKPQSLVNLCIGVLGRHLEDIIEDLEEIAIGLPGDIKLAVAAIARRRKLLSDDVLIALADASWEILDVSGSDVSDFGLIKAVERCETVAVKVLGANSRQGEQGFLTEVLSKLYQEGETLANSEEVEVELLSRLQSPYLLALLGYCSDHNHKLLVCEFMANDGLQEHLYPAGIQDVPVLFQLCPWHFLMTNPSLKQWILLSVQDT